MILGAEVGDVIRLKAKPKGADKFVEEKTKFLISQGYSANDVSRVMSEFREYLPAEVVEFEVNLPGSLGLSDQQSEAITELVNKHFIEISDYHGRAQDALLHTILGLLVRELGY